ncbi:hypothetical protein [Prosthecobacter sp.]|uniref:hypothetical protein n=1 Tax=Prosthecobacter sp. TaxID=1965333 RepID=UPI0037836229
MQKCPHTTSHWSCFGRVIAASFDPATGQPSDCGALLGVCVIKLAHRLRDTLTELEPVAAAIQQALSGIPGHWLLSSTTGWEDLVLLFWTDELLTLSQALAQVRSLKVQKVKPDLQGGVHAVLTTCTLTGVSLPEGVFDPVQKKFLPAEWVRRMESIQTLALVDWALRFEVRPGHMDPFKHELATLATQVGQASIVEEMHNVLGQYDFRIQYQGGTQKEWLQFLGNVALPLAARSGSLVRSMETHLHIRFQTCSEGVSAPNVVRPPAESLPQSVLQRIQHSCAEFGIAPHTVEMLDATYSRLQALREDDLQQGTFESVANLFNHLAAGLEALMQQQQQQDGRPPVEAAFLGRDFCSWLCWMERCLADRYRGTYPLGESIITRVGTYQASYHGFLAAMDCIAQEAYDLAREFCNRACPDLPPIPAVTVCSFIGSAPSPNIFCFPHLRCGFIELPPGLIFRLHDLPVLLHEVGHLFERVVSHHFKFAYDFRPGDPETTQIREILAEAFACCACFGRDMDSYAAHRLSLVDTYLPQPASKFVTSHFLVNNIRLTAVHWLLNALGSFSTAQDAFREFSRRVESIVKGELDSTLPGDESAQSEDEARKAVKPCENAFYAMAQLYYGHSDFRIMLDAMRSLQDLSSRATSLKALPFAQTFIQQGSHLPADHFRFIEAMVARAAS